MDTIATIANRQSVNKYKPIANSTIDNRQLVDKELEIDILLKDCSDLITGEYKGWFANQFRRLNRDVVTRLASQARADGKNPARLFSFLLKKELA